MKTTGIILAGGESSRMNYIDKGLIEIDGKACILHVIDAIKSEVDELLIISNNEAYKQFGYDVYPDIYFKKGPMGGLFTGLSHSKTDQNILVACDMPKLSSEIFQLLKEKSKEVDIVVPVTNGRFQPLCALYKKSLLKNHCLELLLIRGILVDVPHGAILVFSPVN